MSGLTLLTWVKLDDRQAFRRWARTARTAAAEVGDPVTYSWVLAQEAYGHYYSGDLAGALDVAKQTQVVARHTGNAGAPLAAALEARVYAVMGQSRPSHRRASADSRRANIAARVPGTECITPVGCDRLGRPTPPTRKRIGRDRRDWPEAAVRRRRPGARATRGGSRHGRRA